MLRRQPHLSPADLLPMPATLSPGDLAKNAGDIEAAIQSPPFGRGVAVPRSQSVETHKQPPATRWFDDSSSTAVLRIESRFGDLDRSLSHRRVVSVCRYE